MKTIGTGKHKHGLHSLLGRAFAMAAAMALLSSCISENDYDAAADCPLEPTASGKYTVNLTISASSPATRASYEYVNGSAAENFIDIEQKDFAVFIIDAGNNEIVQRFSPEDIVLKQDESDTFKYYISGTLTANREITAIRILVLANWAQFQPGIYDTFAGQAVGKKLADIYADASSFLFDLYAANASGVQTWQPVDQTRGIPMTGLSNAIGLGSDQLLKPSETINMLRALAKVEIVDNTEDGLTGVTLSCVNANGRFVPDGTANPNWYKPAPAASTSTPSYVSTPSLPASETTATNIAFVPQGATEIEGEMKPVWVAYIPEMHVASGKRNDHKRPTFTLTTETESTTKFFDYYENGQSFHDSGRSDQLESALRNCIYCYTVSAASKFLELELEVLDWTMKQEDVFHFDNPQILEEFYLTWNLKKIVDGEEVDNGAKDVKEELRLYMMPGVDDYIEGTFTLAAPLNAKWSASLVSLQGDLDAFEFVQEEGRDYSCGIIDGGPCTIRIRNKKEIVSNEHNEARLVIMVEYPDKTTKEAFVVKTQTLVIPGEGDQEGEVRFVKNYTIVQELTNFM